MLVAYSHNYLTQPHLLSHLNGPSFVAFDATTNSTYIIEFVMLHFCFMLCQYTSPFFVINMLFEFHAQLSKFVWKSAFVYPVNPNCHHCTYNMLDFLAISSVSGYSPSLISFPIKFKSFLIQLIKES